MTASALSRQLTGLKSVRSNQEIGAYLSILPYPFGPLYYRFSLLCYQVQHHPCLGANRMNSSQKMQRIDLLKTNVSIYPCKSTRGQTDCTQFKGFPVLEYPGPPQFRELLQEPTLFPGVPDGDVARDIPDAIRKSGHPSFEANGFKGADRERQLLCSSYLETELAG
jgi:hypothetical protein